MSLNRRTVIKGALATGVATSALKIPAAPAQAGPIRVGFLTIKTGPLASGGLQMEQGADVLQGTQQHALRPPGRAASPPTPAAIRRRRVPRPRSWSSASTCMSDRSARRLRGARHRRLYPLVEDADPHRRRRRRHDPAQAEPLAGASELAPRRSRATRGRLRRQGSEAQARSRSPTISPSAMRMLRASCAPSRMRGGKVVQKLFTPLNAPDYGTYVSQLKNADGVYTGHAGSNGFKFVRQLPEYGRRASSPSSAASRRSMNRCCSRWAMTARRSPAAGIRPRSTSRSTSASSPRSSATTRSTPASMPPRPICAARCSNTR